MKGTDPFLRLHRHIAHGSWKYWFCTISDKCDMCIVCSYKSRIPLEYVNPFLETGKKGCQGTPNSRPPRSSGWTEPLFLSSLVPKSKLSNSGKTRATSAGAAERSATPEARPSRLLRDNFLERVSSKSLRFPGKRPARAPLSGVGSFTSLNPCRQVLTAPSRS